MRRDALVIVETDDETLEATLRAIIRHEGHRAVTVRAGKSGGDENKAATAAAIILDLSNRQGFDVLVRLRASSEAPIIVVAADNSEQAVADAFDHGADDYLTKPLRLRELGARLRRALRRRTNGARDTAPAPFRTGDLIVDLYTRTVTLGDAPVRLTEREYAILATLVLHKGAAVSVKELVSNVRDDAPVAPRRYLSECIANMRRKLEPTPEAPRYLLTVPGIGYRLGLAD